jgi:hypothetical protein
MTSFPVSEWENRWVIQENRKAASAEAALLLLRTAVNYSPRFQFIRSPRVVVEPDAAGAL